jgi:hypothetical protein
VNNDTIIQAAVAGDTIADFTITLAGLRPFTAANFALTPSQSSAALANGAALSYTRVTTAAGAPTEYAYSNVQGRAYTSYESFYGSAYEDLAADDLNLSSNENKLVLYDPSQTVTRGGGSEALQVGTGSDPLAYHAVETIDASTSSGEQFVFSAGFGKETINGFSVSGTTPDSIQLAKAAFSYLTPGMTQAELGGRHVPSHQERIRPDDRRLAWRQPDTDGGDPLADRRQPRHARIHVDSSLRGPSNRAALSHVRRPRLRARRAKAGAAAERPGDEASGCPSPQRGEAAGR